MMNQFVGTCVALLTFFASVEPLTCKTCNPFILGSCLITSPINCTRSENRCYTAVAEFSDGLLPLHAKGCIEASKCQNQTNLSILTVTYNITLHCCSDDLCNGAASTQLPLAAALGAALVAVWSQWGF